MDLEVIIMEEIVIRLKGLAGLLDAGTNNKGNLLNQQEIFSFLSSELLDVAEEIEDTLKTK